MAKNNNSKEQDLNKDKQDEQDIVEQFREMLDESVGDKKKSLWQKPGFISKTLSIITFIVLLIIFVNEIKNQISPEELKKSLKISWSESMFVNKSITPYEVTIVPSIKIKIQNTGSKTLKTLRLSASFIFADNGESLGEGVANLITKPLKPGETTNPITIRSMYGFKGSSKQAFIKNIDKWKKVKARILARVNSGMVNIGEIDVKQVIEGVEKNLSEKDKKDIETRNEMLKTLISSIKIEEKEAYWRYKTYSKDKIIIVPSIKFNFTNIGKTPLHNLAFKGEFFNANSNEIFTTGVITSIKTPLSSKMRSKEIVVNGDYGYSASNVKQIENAGNNIQELMVRLFVKSSATEYGHLGTFVVKKTIKYKAQKYQR